jgi:hypothetical protein
MLQVVAHILFRIFPAFPGKSRRLLATRLRQDMDPAPCIHRGFRTLPLIEKKRRHSLAFSGFVLDILTGRVKEAIDEQVAQLAGATR